MTNPPINSNLIETYFKAIELGDSDSVREILEKERNLTKIKRRGEYQYDTSIELDAYKFLGAYLGAVSGLQLALLLGYDSIARDIADITFDQDLNMIFGDNNTTLHLAAFLENKEMVQSLLERGADANAKNGKGFTPLDVSNDSQVSKLLSKN
ncbi:hypothetical protein K502DRAFT_315980 [Neoconidiobolus thromboides FSU 785]|nr:hypothetical protein K502DRAFT_315980 [Neoconidiobolus thromboides FSU 785]